MQLTINGEVRTVAEVDTVAALLDHLGVTHQAVAVMVNGAVIPRERYASTFLADSDALEIVRFVGGG
ncbi:MAG: sulfur carrier protein ThiS [Firmicutes bacterium]|nr:sulfur carrier protein ThiS [Alicyclobacillaceae bacterium]MCL6496191.1 sulfur carrier protein ThiS [Bacillota bacterium]